MRKISDLWGRCGFQGIIWIRIAASCQMPWNEVEQKEILDATFDAEFHEMLDTMGQD